MSSQLQGSNAITMCLSTPGLAIGSTPSQIAIGTAFAYAINGLLYSKTTDATEAMVMEPGMGPNALAKSTFQTVAPGKTCAFSVYIDAAGTLTIGQGDIVDNGANAPVREAPPNKCLIGVVKVVNNTMTANGGYRPGTDSLADAGLVDTYINVAQHPGAGV